MKKTRKILAIVVTYYPEKELLEKNISAFIDHVDKVLIWENTPEPEKLNYRFIEHEKVEYHGDGINSISHGLNYGWQYAKKYGYDYLLTMDQDSLWQDFKLFCERTINCSAAPYGIWVPLVNDDENRKQYQLRDSSITSGSLIPIDILDKIGGWNEFFMVDSVDTEFFAHARSLNLGVYAIGDCHLNQHYGTPQLVKFVGHSFELRNDSPQRLFQIYRNYLIATRMYPSIKSLWIGFRMVWLKKIKWILVFETGRIRKFAAIFYGIICGLTFKLPKSS